MGLIAAVCLKNQEDPDQSREAISAPPFPNVANGQLTQGD